jgi:molybdopterin-guanine dinucleotide biosynthesis protein A
METMRSPVDGFVLVGGGSRRFGSDKARALFEGETLVRRAAALLRRSGCTVHLAGAVERDYGIEDAAWVTDEEPGRGPAAALAGCLHRARAWALVLAVDMPWLTTGVLDRLMARRDEGAALAICFRDTSGRRHPFPGLYHRDLLEMLASGPFGSMQEILDGARILLLDQGSEPEDLDLSRGLRNANRPDDLRS